MQNEDSKKGFIFAVQGPEAEVIAIFVNPTWKLEQNFEKMSTDGVDCIKMKWSRSNNIIRISRNACK